MSFCNWLEWDDLTKKYFSIPTDKNLKTKSLIKSKQINVFPTFCKGEGVHKRILYILSEKVDFFYGRAPPLPDRGKVEYFWRPPWEIHSLFNIFDIIHCCQYIFVESVLIFPLSYVTSYILNYNHQNLIKYLTCKFKKIQFRFNWRD